LGDKPNNRPNEERWEKLLINDKKMEIKQGLPQESKEGTWNLEREGQNASERMTPGCQVY